MKSARAGAGGMSLQPWLPVLFYMGAIFLLSSFSLRVPSAPGIPMTDKIAHTLEFAGLGYLCARASLLSFADRPPVRAVLVGVLITVAWGVADELHQAFVPERSPDLLDLVADTFGASLGASIRFVQVRATRPAPAQEP